MSLGISPEYFLDEMSFDEVSELLKAENEREKRTLERDRLNWFHTYRAMGSDVKSPEMVQRFEWEKKPKKEPKKLTDEEKIKRAEKAKNYIKHGKQRL